MATSQAPEDPPRSQSEPAWPSCDPTASSPWPDPTSQPEHASLPQAPSHPSP